MAPCKKPQTPRYTVYVTIHTSVLKPTAADPCPFFIPAAL